MLDDVEAYDGVHGLFVYSGCKDSHFVKVAYHEGLVPAYVWLRVLDRKAHQSKFPSNKKVQSSWFVGLVKCKERGKTVAVDGSSRANGKTYKYF